MFWSIFPIEAETMPLPKPLITPPVMKTQRAGTWIIAEETIYKIIPQKPTIWRRRLPLWREFQHFFLLEHHLKGPGCVKNGYALVELPSFFLVVYELASPFAYLVPFLFIQGLVIGSVIATKVPQVNLAV